MSKPVHLLLKSMVSAFKLCKGQVFTKYQVLAFFHENHAGINEATVLRQLQRLTTNAPGRVHYSPKPGDDDLFYQEKSGHYRLYDPSSDPLPIHGSVVKEATADASPDVLRFPGDDPTDFAGAPHITPMAYSSEFSLIAIISDCVPMTFEQKAAKLNAEQEVKEVGLQAVAATQGWTLFTEHEFEPWYSYEIDSEDRSEDKSEDTNATLHHERAEYKYWEQIRKWNNDFSAAMAAHLKHPQLIAEPMRPRVWCARRDDPFNPRVSDEWQRDLINLIRETPHFDWLLATRYPERIGDYMTQDPEHNWHFLCPNAWLGVIVENQEAADQRIPELLCRRLPKYFLCCDPLVDPLDLRNWLGERCQLCQGDGLHCVTCGYSGWRIPPVWQRPAFSNMNLRIQWCIVGGEYGQNARRMHFGWARSLRDQCRAAGVPFYFRRTGTALAIELGSESNDGSNMYYVPDDLHVREYP